ncbi:MAG: hypothetical protein QM589_02665 [Thermomicrobiales bacterium]
MNDRQAGTGLDEEALASRVAISVDDTMSEAMTPDEQPASESTSMIRISPKWQLILIGGGMIAINVILAIVLLVALALRH